MPPTREQWKKWTNAINDILPRNRENINLGVLKRLEKEDADPIWKIIQTSSMNHIFYMSRADYTILLNILNSYLKTQNLSLRIDIDKIKKSYLEEIDRKFKENPKKRWRKKDIEDILVGTISTAKSHLTTTTYYIPCHLPPDKNIKSFNIGPINFLHIDTFWESVTAYIDDYKTDIDSKRAGLLAKHMEEVFNEYAWVAKVTVENSDANMGYNIAEICVRATIAFISTFYDDVIVNMINKDEFKYSKNAKFIIDSNEKCAISSQINYKTGKESEYSWLPYFLGDSCRYSVECFDVIIDQKLKKDTLTNASQIFLDSLMWYYDAISDKNKGASAIKLATCLETLIPESKYEKQISNIECGKCGNSIQYISSDSVTKKFIKWISFLSEGIKVENKKLISSETVALFYDARSSLVHGNFSQNSRKSLTPYEAWEIGRKLAQDCLKHYLMWVTKEGFAQGFTDEQVAKYMEERFPGAPC